MHSICNLDTKSDRYALPDRSYEPLNSVYRRFGPVGKTMATTIPNVIRELGNRHRYGFTKQELVAAFIMAGYGPEKAVRRFAQCRLSKQIIPVAEDADTHETLWVSIYCPFHWQGEYKEKLDQVRIVPVHIARDGTPIFL